MTRLFDSAQAEFSENAKFLANYNADQGLSLPTWGNPERQKINDCLVFANMFRSLKGL